MLIPLIVACALFMENLDSTAIATALPAIAASLGENPLKLSLAITAYLFSLAVFIPISGWVADRFGAKQVFRLAILVFMLGSVLCSFAGSLFGFVLARILQGMGGAMMVPVGRLVLLRAVAKAELVQAMAWLTVPALMGPILGPPLGGFITTYAELALDLLDQPADRRARDCPGLPVHSRPARGQAAAPRPSGLPAQRHRAARPGVRLRNHRARPRALEHDAPAAGSWRRRHRASTSSMPCARSTR